MPRAVGAARFGSPLLALALALLPKCPICGAAYLSAAGWAALPTFTGWIRYWPVIALVLLGQLLVLAWMARSARRWATLAGLVAGAALIAGPGLAIGNDIAMLAGVACVVAGSISGIVSARRRTLPRRGGCAGPTAGGTRAGVPGSPRRHPEARCACASRP